MPPFTVPTAAPSVDIIHSISNTSVVNTVAETEFFRKQISAAFLGSTGVLRFRATGFVTNLTGARNYTLRFYYGATLIAGGTAISIAGTPATGGPFDIELILAALTINTQRCWAKWKQKLSYVGAGEWNTGGDPLFLATGSHKAIAEDSTVSKDFYATIEMSLADPNLSFTVDSGTLETLKVA